MKVNESYGLLLRLKTTGF